MALDFILSSGEYVELGEADFQKAKLIRPDMFKTEEDRFATLFFEYGKNRSGYFESDKFLPCIEKALFILHFKYPKLQFAVVVDRSSVHERFADDALRAGRMNVNPGGKQPRLRSTFFRSVDGKITPQSMVFPEDHAEFPNYPKGLWHVCLERGLVSLASRSQTRKKDLQDLLEQQEDFKTERSLLQKLIEDQYGDILLLLPKYHPELNPIEYVWAIQKKYARANCGYSIRELRQIVRAARNHVTTEQIERCVRKARDFANVYRQGFNGASVIKCIKLYKSHRKVPKKAL